MADRTLVAVGNINNQDGLLTMKTVEKGGKIHTQIVWRTQLKKEGT